MKQLTKQEYQKRSLTITCLLHHFGETKHPSKWTENELLGAIEKAIKKIEDGDTEE